MRILIDTNILISAAIFPNSTPSKAFIKAVTVPHQALVCEQNIDEMKRVFFRKFPNKIDALDKFLAAALLALEVVPVPEEKADNEELIRDYYDRPILRAAIKAKADILLSGDRDFLESGIKSPRIMTPAEFLNF